MHCGRMPQGSSNRGEMKTMQSTLSQHHDMQHLARSNSPSHGVDVCPLMGKLHCKEYGGAVVPLSRIRTHVTYAIFGWPKTCA